MRILAILACFLMFPTAASAQPSAIPLSGGMTPKAGAPYVLYGKIVAPTGLPEWSKRWQQLSGEFQKASADLQQLALQAKAAEDKYNKAPLAEAAKTREEAEAALRAYGVRSDAYWQAFGARQDQLLNPLVPALLADLKTFAQEKGLGNDGLPVFMPQYAGVLKQVGMRDVTDEFVAWSAAHHRK